MVFTVRGLPRLSGRAYYELFLTRNGKPVAPCGGFNGKPGTTTLEFFVYQTAFSQGEFGYAAAVGVVLFVIVFGISVVQLRLLRDPST